LPVSIRFVLFNIKLKEYYLARKLATRSRERIIVMSKRKNNSLEIDTEEPRVGRRIIAWSWMSDQRFRKWLGANPNFHPSFRVTYVIVGFALMLLGLLVDDASEGIKLIVAGGIFLAAFWIGSRIKIRKP
jgi:hypothetical protein